MTSKYSIFIIYSPSWQLTVKPTEEFSSRLHNLMKWLFENWTIKSFQWCQNNAFIFRSKNESNKIPLIKGKLKNKCIIPPLFEQINRFNFQTIISLMYSRGVRLTWFDCNYVPVHYSMSGDIKENATVLYNWWFCHCMHYGHISSCTDSSYIGMLIIFYLIF